MGRKNPLWGALASLVVFGAVTTGSPAFGSSLDDDSVQTIVDGLRGLSFDEFVDESYKQILLRSPQEVTSLGLSEAFGIRDDRLDNICNEFVDETYDLKDGILDILQTYPRRTLGYEQQISLDSYTWILEAWADEREFMYHFYPVNHGLSRQNWLFRFFSDEHPLETLENAEDYISRLDEVDDQFACLVSNLEDSQQRGILAPAQMLQWAADRVRDIVPGTARELSLYTDFATKLDEIDGLSTTQRQNLLLQAEQAINSSVIPAYQALVTKLDQQVPLAPPMNGVWQLPDGDRFFSTSLRYNTTTDLTPDEIHQTGLDEVARIRAEIRDRFDALGYPADGNFAELYERVGEDSGIIPADEIVAHAEAIIDQAERDMVEAFDIAPSLPVVVIGGTGTFYVPGALDGSRPGAYYIANVNDTYRYWMRTIAYHEAVPGHHFQIALGNEQDVPLFTKAGLIYTGFVEGWALYAERLAWDLGWYDDDIYSDLGRLQWELLRAARMVVETGLHARRWSRQEAIDYYVDVVGAEPWLAQSQIDLYLYYYPGYFSSYKTGMMKILELRQHARDELGDLFDIKEFHRVVLLHNRMPLALLEQVVQDYIDKRSNPPPAPRRPAGRRSTGP
jgi:uncharacterized protein (DUF885 family)